MGAIRPLGARGATGADGDDGAAGPAGPAPSGTGLVDVVDGVVQTPSTLAARVAADAATIAASLGLGAVTATGATAALARAALAPARAFDANHTLAWRLDDAVGSTTFAAAVGGTALTPTTLASWVVGSPTLYAGGRCVRVRDAAAGNEVATAAGITPPAGDITVEIVWRSVALIPGIAFGSSQVGLVTLDNGAGGNYLYVRISWSSGNAGLQAGWSPADDIGEQSTSGTAFLGVDVETAVLHHVMVAITKGSGSANGFMRLYLDGVLIATATGIRDSGLSTGTWAAKLCNSSNNLAPKGSFAEYRISNIARDAAYAVAAYEAERARS